jgi:hypothetical protein
MSDPSSQFLDLRALKNLSRFHYATRFRKSMRNNGRYRSYQAKDPRTCPRLRDKLTLELVFFDNAASALNLHHGPLRGPVAVVV